MTIEKDKRVRRSLHLKIGFRIAMSIQIIATFFILLMYIRLIVIYFDIIGSSIFLFSASVNMMSCICAFVTGYKGNRKRLCFHFICLCVWVVIQLFISITNVVLYFKHVGWNVFDVTSILCITTVIIYGVLEVIFFCIVVKMYPHYVDEIASMPSVQFAITANC